MSKTYLLTWNPNRWPWDDYEETAKLTESGEQSEIRWSTGNRNTVKSGDRLFMLRQGEEPRGIIASGWATSDSYEEPHFEEDRAARGDTSPYVDFGFDVLLDVAIYAPLSTSDFASGPLAAVHWNTQSSGIEIPDDAAPELEYLDSNHADIIALSELLNALPIHRMKHDGETFRNPNGVKMKLMNFRRFDSNQQGAGLTRGNRLEKDVWNDFASSPVALAAIADEIKDGYKIAEADLFEADEDVFPEGQIIYRIHRQRERNKSVIKNAKELALRKHGYLRCMVCMFDFEAVYGPLGKHYIEGHHTKPLSELTENAETKVKDIALVCRDCFKTAVAPCV